MSPVNIYGIKNCSTVKKALTWLDENHVPYNFHDYKTEGIDEAVFQQTIEKHGWEKAINRGSMTWRGLTDEVKAAMNTDNAIITARENPSIIKRPLLVTENEIHLGFNAKKYEEIFN